MKDILEFLIKVGVTPIIYSVGVLTIMMFMLSYSKEYAFLSKAVVLYTLTH